MFAYVRPTILSRITSVNGPLSPLNGDTVSSQLLSLQLG